MASNKGKKYKKLRGGEVATPDSASRARKFMLWFGARFEEIRAGFGPLFNDEVAVDTALRIREDIELKGLIINGKLRHYFIRAYNVNLIAHKKREAARCAVRVDIDDQGEDGRPWAELLGAVDMDPHEYEIAVDTLRDEVLEFVRRHHDPVAASLFEIYVELSPDISYARLAQMLGVPYRFVWQELGKIKKDVLYWFSERRVYLIDA